MLFDFAPFEGRAMVAGFDGVAVTSDAGVLLRGAAGRATGLVGRFAACFRAPASRSASSTRWQPATRSAPPTTSPWVPPA